MYDVSHPVAVPSFVPGMLHQALNDCGWVADVLRQANDIEWVSDVANLYRQRLEHVRRLVLAVQDRVREANTDVYVLTHTP
jgi:hypothetical protein